MSILSGDISITTFMVCLCTSIILGAVIAGVHMYKNTYTKSFIITLVMLPAIVQMVITIVNGNLGTGVAVMGAFSLIRFRSVPGSAREISSIFLAMAVGLATGMGYVGIAILFVIAMEVVNLLITFSKFGEKSNLSRSLKITIPESLDYTAVFDDIFEKYTKSFDVISVKTSNMGSLFKLEYNIILKEKNVEKNMIDELRVRNGNLEITCGHKTDRISEVL